MKSELRLLTIFFTVVIIRVKTNGFPSLSNQVTLRRQTLLLRMADNALLLLSSLLLLKVILCLKTLQFKRS